MTTSAKPFEFDRALKELEEITQWFEQADIDLDAGLAKFERGMDLASQLKTHLAEVENRIEKIKRRFAEPAASAPAESVPTEPPVPDTDQTGLF